MNRVSDKKERLIESAARLFYQAGFKDTSIADIAEDSGVPLGNVYYYFKTKDEMVAAVIEQRAEMFKTWAMEWEQIPDPRQRLFNLLDKQESEKDQIAKYGCPVGSLCQELDKGRTTVARGVDGLMSWVLKWITRQFQEMGQKDADRYGLQMMSAIQGCSVVANALDDPKIIELEIARLKAWIKEM
jgi:AcrR family transcriptional regulator